MIADKTIRNERLETMKLINRMLMVLIALATDGSGSYAQNANFAQFDQLKVPRIATRPNQKMLVVETKGDPNVVGGQAFGLLFQLYYRLPQTPKGPPQTFPRARWPEDLTTPKAEWTGRYALPIPESVAKLPEHQAQAGLTASLATWEYGEVAEILHLGPYDREQPTMARLKEFVRSHGYVIVGGHEEEYILGPRQGEKGDPEKYMTLIRYRVRKADRN